MRSTGINRTTKRPWQVLEFSQEFRCDTLGKYSQKFSPKKFTQPSLFACLVLKEFLQLDYLKLAAMPRSESLARTVTSTEAMVKLPRFDHSHFCINC